MITKISLGDNNYTPTIRTTLLICMAIIYKYGIRYSYVLDIKLHYLSQAADAENLFLAVDLLQEI